MVAPIKETRDAIKALPGMTALHASGEWRVTINLYRLSERYPEKSTTWCKEKQEEMAYYTPDAEDALATAKKMSEAWVAEAQRDVSADAGQVNDAGLTKPQQEALNAFREAKGRNWKSALRANWERASYPGVSADHAAALQQVRNTLGPEWLTKYRAPEPKAPEQRTIDPLAERDYFPERVKALGDEPFWDAYPGKTEYVVLTIEETGNAAFVDLGRDQEVARIIDEAADKIASHASIGDADFVLRDMNGNRVGRVEVTTVTPTGDMPDSTVRLAIETGNAAFEHDANLEVSLLLRGAAEKVRDGEHVFALHDTNGNMVGKFEYREEPSLAKNGVIDMNQVLNSGRVYLAEDGWSGIADGEYRFIVPTPDFEPGYGQGEGDVWLVNAKGEIADGYESPQSVRETLFRELNRDEKSDLRAVVEGRVPFEEYERRFSDDDPELA